MRGINRGKVYCDEKCQRRVWRVQVTRCPGERQSDIRLITLGIACYALFICFLQETVWLDRLEKKLEKSAQTTAADAEEISEVIGNYFLP